MPIISAARSFFVRQGIVVPVPPSGQPINPGAEFVRFPEDNPRFSDEKIEELAIAAGLAATAVYIMCPQGYTGPSVRYEIACMVDAGKQPYFSEQPGTTDIQRHARGRIASMQQLATMVLRSTLPNPHA